MIKVLLNEAEEDLGHLIEKATAGEDVIISGAHGARVRLVPLTDLSFRESGESSRAIGTGLDRFIGTWSAEQEAEVLEAVAIFDQIDESFWS